VVNSTIGLAGVFDVTGASGLPREPSGFSETLNRYGAPQGPYIFLPLFGPSSVRDLTGRVVDVVTDPFNWINYDGRAAVQGAKSVATGLDLRDRADPVLKDVNRTATDPYATLRSAFLQSSSTTGRRETDVKALPDFGPEPAPSRVPAPASDPSNVRQPKDQ
jgi:phospholipid-binding lipoprotein MlaA